MTALYLAICIFFYAGCIILSFTSERGIKGALWSAFLSVICVSAIGLIALGVSIIFVKGVVFLISLL